MSQSSYTEININNFFNMTGELPFDVYIQIGADKFTKLFQKGDHIDRERFDNYKSKGVENLYIHKKERREYIAASERLVHRILSKSDITHEEAQVAVEELTEQTLFEIYEDKVFDEHSLRRAQTIVQNYVALVADNAKNLANFINMSRNETYTCRHAIATTVFSILIALADDNLNEKTLNIVGLGGLLHDLGMSRLPKEVNEINRELTLEEWKMVKDHPIVGGQIASQTKAFPEEVIQVIEQHHEYWDGSGYPNGLRGTNIYYPARIVALADSFSALTTRRGGRALYPPQEAIMLMRNEDGKFDPQLMKRFLGLLGQTKPKAA
jgi:putative nucleotidyltransferase with HDIG domain